MIDIRYPIKLLKENIKVLLIETLDKDKASESNERISAIEKAIRILEVPKCLKCGSDDLHLKYDEEDDKLNKECGRCSFWWQEDPIDKVANEK